MHYKEKLLKEIFLVESIIENRNIRKYLISEDKSNPSGLERNESDIDSVIFEEKEQEF